MSAEIQAWINELAQNRYSANIENLRSKAQTVIDALNAINGNMGSAGGSTGQVQFNNAGTLAGTPLMTVDATNGNIAVPGNIAISGNFATTGNRSGDVNQFAFTSYQGGSVLTAGVQPGAVVVPFDCVITGRTLMTDQTGNITIDLFKGNLTSYPPTGNINGSAPANVSTGNLSQDNLLTGWTTALKKNDILEAKILGAPTQVQWASLCITVKRTA